METPLHGKSACVALDTVAKVEAVTYTAEGIKERFPKLFSGMGCMESEYEFNLKPSHKQFNETAPRRVPIRYCRKVRKNWTGWKR